MISFESATSGDKVFSSQVLDIDCAEAAAKAETAIREAVFKTLHRKGAVVAMSGGIDSSVVAFLCARALGVERTLGLFLPEHESSDESLRLGRAAADTLGIDTETANIGPALEAMGCYRYRLEAIREVFPDFGDDWKSKIVLPPIGDKGRLNIFSLVVQPPDGEVRSARLPLEPYLKLVGATNMKQRTRKLMEYYHADRLNYAVAGTPNRLEYDQGFFVKGGDGLADFKPIAHLYKTQVYALAEFLGVPEEIRRRPPTTDTYSLPQSQEEFYFALPYDKMDLCLWARNHEVPMAEVAKATGLTERQVEFVYGDIEAKRRTTRYLHMPPVLAEEVPEIESS
jgi:NAD+ synthase